MISIYQNPVSSRSFEVPYNSPTIAPREAPVLRLKELWSSAIVVEDTYLGTLELCSVLDRQFEIRNIGTGYLRLDLDNFELGNQGLTIIAWPDKDVLGENEATTFTVRATSDCPVAGSSSA